MLSGPNGCSIAGAITMLLGSAVYMLDQSTSTRNWHLFLIPALVLMAVGAVLALVGQIRGDA